MEHMRVITHVDQPSSYQAYPFINITKYIQKIISSLRGCHLMVYCQKNANIKCGKV